MTRRDSVDPKWFDEKVQACFVGEKTTAGERRKLALDWCMGDYQSYVTLAHERGLLPIALIVGALVDIEHPLLVERGQLVTKELVGCSVIVLKVEFRREAVHIPVVDKLGTGGGQVPFVHSENARLPGDR